MARPEDLSEGSQIANYFDQLLKSGKFGDFVNSSPAVPDIPSEDEVLRQKLNVHIEKFIGSIPSEALRVLDKRAIADAVRNNFAIWKTGLTQYLADNHVAESEVEAVDALTLKDVAGYAREQFNRFKGEAATLPPGTPEQQEARGKSNYWSIMDEIITPASDPD